MAFPYKHVLLVGATSGIGRALADRLVLGGAKVTAVGRRQDKLDEFVTRHGESKVAAVSFDVSNIEKIPQFVKDVTTASPDIDCVFLNAGVQRSHDLSKPETLDLALFNSEITVNFTSFVTFSQAFLPFLLAKKTQTSFIITGSNLSIVPASPMPAYSASKAALNAYTLCLRDHLRHTNIKVIDLSPGAVQTELHDYMGVEKGRQVGMPLDKFTEEAYEGLVSGKDKVIVGSTPTVDNYLEIASKRRAGFESLAKFMRGGAD